jgi:ubiquinone/menaquinone biosynthesis C-methylase UbiE
MIKKNNNLKENQNKSKNESVQNGFKKHWNNIYNKMKKEDYDFFNYPKSIDYFLEEIISNKILYHFHKKFIDKLPIKKTDKILEFGFHSGICTTILSKKTNEEVLAIDEETDWTEIAKKRLKDTLKNKKNLTLLVEDIKVTKLNKIKDNHYDILFVHFKINDIALKERKNVIKTLLKKLRKGGLFILREPVNRDFGIPIKILIGFQDEFKIHLIKKKIERHLLVGKITSMTFEKI